MKTVLKMLALGVFAGAANYFAAEVFQLSPGWCFNAGMITGFIVWGLA